MKLLYVTESVPNRDPAGGDGSSMIPYELICHFPPNVEVTLITFGGQVPLPDQISRRCRRVLVLPTRSDRIAQLRSIFTMRDAGSELRSTHRVVREIRRWSAMSDVTLLHGPHVASFGSEVEGPVVWQTVDPWSTRLRMDAALVRGWRSRYRGAKAERAQSMAQRLPARIRLLTVGAADASDWADRLSRRVRSIPNGVEQIERPPRQPGPPVACFVGSLNYGPNVDSARILALHIAPAVWQSIPTARFVIAGRQPVPAVQALAGDRIDVLANVPSVTEVFHRSDVAVFADESGVGVRNSVREALAAGVPVLATAAAAREQSEHPLLTLVPDTTAIPPRLTAMLSAAEDRGHGDGTNPAIRGWDDVVSDYLEELSAAIAVGDRGVDEPEDTHDRMPGGGEIR